MQLLRLLKKANLRCSSSGCLLAYTSTRRSATLIAPSISTFLNSLGQGASIETIVNGFLNNVKRRGVASPFYVMLLVNLLLPHRQ